MIDDWLNKGHMYFNIFVFCFWWTNQELKQWTVTVELLKQTTPKNCIFMPFLDTNIHLTTKPYNFDIKCQSNSKSYDRHVFLGPILERVRIFINSWRFFQQERVLWGWLAGPSLSRGRVSGCGLWRNWKVTGDTQQVTHDTWHMTPNTWHLTWDT